VIGKLHHEAPGIDLRGTFLSAAFVVGMVILSCIAGRQVYRLLLHPSSERSATPLYGEGLALPVEPRLEGIEMMTAANTTSTATTNTDALNRYGWIDREKRIVRIPIQRAMELAIERGWLRSAIPSAEETRSTQADSSNSPAKSNSSQ
jgi:hypothetical protein